MAKYAERRFVLRKEELDPGRLYDAVRSRDLTSLLQLYAEGADLAKPLILPVEQVNIQKLTAASGFTHRHFFLNYVSVCECG